MKMTLILLALVWAMGIACLSAFAADYDNNPPGPVGGPDSRPDKFNKADTNHDGVLDRSEWQKAAEILGQRRQKIKTKADTNHDGTVDATERQAAQEKRAERLEHRKQRADCDNNPPGPAGGRGSNWENPPGAAGGPGTSPDSFPRT